MSVITELWFIYHIWTMQKPCDEFSLIFRRQNEVVVACTVHVVRNITKMLINRYKQGFLHKEWVSV